VSILIETSGLTKQYRVGRQPIDALVNFSVRIERGEFVAIVGPSGSGKSTCMHMLGCLQSPTRGSYRLEGEEVTAMDSDSLAEIRSAKIGFVFQAFHLQPRVSARRNVELPLVYAGVPRTERRARAVQALEAVGLAERADHRPAQLSGGEMQRVAIARALVNQPPLLLTDEPTGSLDSQTGAEILALLSNLNQSGITVVMVTHDTTVAARAQRVLQLLDGVMVADRPVDQPLP
jgi:putative ABC transport system ATP-binding protein